MDSEYDLIIFTDGSGASSFCGGKACAVVTEDGKTPTEVIYREYADKLTCNEAEYYGVILALEEQLSHRKIKIISDSMLIVNQLKTENPWKINFEHLKNLNQSVRDIISNFELEVNFEHVSRDHNLAGLYIEGRLMVSNDIITRRE